MTTDAEKSNQFGHIPARFAFIAVGGEKVLAFERVGDKLVIEIGEGLTPTEACQQWLDMLAEHFPFWVAEYQKRLENA